jgi:hypothetical protein
MTTEKQPKIEKQMKIDANDVLSAEGPGGLARVLRETPKTPMPKPPPKPSVTSDDARSGDKKPTLRNFTSTIVDSEDGTKKRKTTVIPIKEISSALFSLTGNWPRRASDLLFSDEHGKIITISKFQDLFSWTHERVNIDWHSGACSDGHTSVTKQEFYSHICRATAEYAAVEEYPHVPEIKNHYYAWKPPESYTPTGEYFDKLLAHFDNPKTPDDKTLIEAALMTPAWGGPIGRRPAIVIMADDVGCGKSTLATCIGELYGGHLELSLTHNAEDKMVSRLLTPSSLTKRVVRIDNIKLNYDSAFVEGLITAPSISGHRLFHGDASRPNTLTFILTGNGLQLSRDIAERSIIIRLQKPGYRSGWEDSVLNFVGEFRQQILADIVARLQASAQLVENVDRYTDWAHGVLAHCQGDPNTAMATNRTRRTEADETVTDADIILFAIRNAAEARHSDRLNNIRQGGESVDDVAPETHEFFSTTEIAEMIARATGERITTCAATRRINAHIAAGRLECLAFDRSRGSSGFWFAR